MGEIRNRLVPTTFFLLRSPYLFSWVFYVLHSPSRSTTRDLVCRGQFWEEGLAFCCSAEEDTNGPLLPSSPARRGGDGAAHEHLREEGSRAQVKAGNPIFCSPAVGDRRPLSHVLPPREHALVPPTVALNKRGTRGEPFSSQPPNLRIRVVGGVALRGAL
ncbi:unnamed protein product [Linum trigynum]|uniref:Uncharacterized protein n=1 Tax=Linum trigynum TaxID=586398 RepID=A0AAV2EB45_9ROSI